MESNLDTIISMESACDPATFRNGMRLLAGAVSVVTVGRPGERTGLTATAVMSLSVDPPTLLVSVNRESSSWRAICEHREFGVNVLADHQQHIADRFAGRGGAKGNERYALGDWRTLKTGAPILSDALVAFDCQLSQRIDLHTHSLFIGLVVAVQAPADLLPMLYWQGAYKSLEVETRVACRKLS